MAATKTNDAAVAPVITLTTDFGMSDAYVAAMKGVIFGINSRAAVVDVSHDVRPQQVFQAVFLTQTAWPYFPRGSIHVAIVDPGVGTARRAIALRTPDGLFVGPDNGVLSSALPDEARPGNGDSATAVDVPPDCEAVALANERYMLEPVSPTFHGRDLFAPAAAHLSLGVALSEFGEPVERLLAYPPLRARRADDGSLHARIVHIDRFGNVVTDARADDLPAHGFTVELVGETVRGPVRTYAEAKGLAALVGSSGYLEVALPNGSAASALGADLGDPVIVRP